MKKTNTFLLLLGVALCCYSCQQGGTNDQKGLLDSSVADNTRIIDYAPVANVLKSKDDHQSGKRLPAAVPAIPADAIDMVATNYQSWQAGNNRNYFVPKGANWTSDIQLKNNTNYYIQGSLKLNSWGSGGTIYVLPGGKLEVSGTLDGVNIENHGEVTFSGNIAINTGSSFRSHTEELLSFESINVQGTFDVLEDVICHNNFTASSGHGVVNIGGGLVCEGTFNLTNGAEAAVWGLVKAKNIQTDSSAELVLGSCAEVTETVTATNNSLIVANSYLATKNISLSASGKIEIYAGTLISCTGKLEFGNGTARIYNEDETGYAVVSCAEVVIHHDAIDRLGRGPIDFHATKITNNTGKDLRWTANVIFNGKTYIPSDGCRPAFGEQPSPSEPEYVLSHIAEVVSPDTKRISATAIDFSAGNAFVSWHISGDPFEGYIDILDIENRNIEATFHAPTLDFNHIYTTDGQVYVAGGRKAGAFYAKVDYNPGSGNVDLTLHKVSGSSGNCVLKNGNEFWVVSGANGGITLLPQDRFISLEEAKYVVKTGNSMIVIAGTDNATVYVYDLSGQLQNSFPVGNIAPKNGKNAMATDGETLYVALGYGGVKAFRNGTEIASFNETNKALNPAANCVDVDDEFVYVANGNAGLYILNKSDLSLVKSYTLGGASANFVKKGADGLIYVAYGLKGVHTFKLHTL